jgi:epoxyqueuosine reductase QueG
MNNDNVMEFLKGKGIHIIGFASITDKIPVVNEDFSPLKLLSSAKTVICLAVPIARGVIYTESNDTSLYWRYCNMMYRSIDAIVNSLCLHLEDNGYISTPVYSCYPWKIVNRDFWGLVPLVYWAENAGLGRLTKSGLLGHPKYGTRMLLGGVITSMSLEPSKRIQKEICPVDCIECIKLCPVRAIDKSGKVDHNLCIRNANTNPLITHILKDTELREKVNFEIIINTIGVDDHSYYLCLECLKACPLNEF